VRYLVLSDIHANIDALDAVLDAVHPGQYDAVLVLGDLVGYGAEPNLVIDRVRSLSPLAIVRGNHDKVAAGLESADGFNQTAQRAAAWTRGALTAENRAFLHGLDPGPLLVDDRTEIFHGSPLDEDAYIFAELDAAEALFALRRPIGLFGHTHLPMAATLTPDRVLDVLFQGSTDDRAVVFEEGLHYLVNPGSVGQPRDGNPRAAYAIVDVEHRRADIRRVPYPVEAARDRILAADLPRSLGERLLRGR
jgi:predicted phosphodiesterase